MRDGGGHPVIKTWRWSQATLLYSDTQSPMLVVPILRCSWVSFSRLSHGVSLSRCRREHCHSHTNAGTYQWLNVQSIVPSDSVYVCITGFPSSCLSLLPGILTTPQLHYLVRKRNSVDALAAVERAYYSQLCEAFCKLVATSGPLIEVTVDGANGVGAIKLAELLQQEGEFPLKISIVYDGSKGRLNYEVMHHVTVMCLSHDHQMTVAPSHAVWCRSRKDQTSPSHRSALSKYRLKCHTFCVAVPL